MDEYSKKMEIAIVQVNVTDDREAIITRFLNRLNRDIMNVVELQYYMKLEHMVYMITNVVGK